MSALVDFALRMPKMELHLHLEGAIRPETALDLAQKNKVTLPPFENVADLYRYETLKEFLDIYTAVSSSLCSSDDFARVTYEMLQSCAAYNARYVEFFFSPQVHLPRSITFATQMDGILAGMAAAETDFGVVSRIAPGVNRELGPQAGQELLDMILDYGSDRLIGIGLDFNEAPFPPEPYADLFARAVKSGLHVTAHAGESGPASFIRGSMDALKVKRIDHGYQVVSDPDLMTRCRDEGMLFTICPSTSAVTSPWKDLSAPDNALRRMKEGGLKIMLNSDDPPMFFTDLGGEYKKAVEFLGFTADDLVATMVNAIDGSWLDESTKRRWKADWMQETEALKAEILI